MSNSEQQFDFILTDPPYSDMLSKEKTGEKKKNGNGDATPFTNSDDDLGNMEREEFLEELKNIIELSASKLKNRGYIGIFAKDLQPKGKNLNMLHAEIAGKLNEISNIYYKGMKIWYDKTINLYPFGYPYAYAMNQLHQYILFFRKENK
jgi:tRNA G10  N-methylase Trm11